MDNKSIKSPYQEETIPDEGRGFLSRDEAVALRVFKDNEKLLKLLRKVFFQMEFTSDEQVLLGKVLQGNQVLYDAMSKIFKPEISVDAPIGNMPSRWIDKKYSDLLASEAKILVLARQDSIKFVENGLKRIENLKEGGSGAPIEQVIDIYLSRDYSNEKDADVKRAICAWQDSFLLLESMGILQIQLLSNMRDETPEEREKRLKKDSTQ